MLGPRDGDEWPATSSGGGTDREPGGLPVPHIRCRVPQVTASLVRPRYGRYMMRVLRPHQFIPRDPSLAVDIVSAEFLADV